MVAIKKVMGNKIFVEHQNTIADNIEMQRLENCIRQARLTGRSTFESRR